jgi:hypothetical protein
MSILLLVCHCSVKVLWNLLKNYANSYTYDSSSVNPFNWFSIINSRSGTAEKGLSKGCLTLLQTLLCMLVELGYIYENPRVSSSIAFMAAWLLFILFQNFPFYYYANIFFVSMRTVQAASNFYMA